ncbi:MAG: hypothetical protein R2812_08665 [Gelidibacter sp.]|nr:hypothetical protein [Gelidibacter sp.]
MILKAFKEKSNQKYINSLLNSRNVAITTKKIESVGVILNLNEFSDFEAFRIYFKSLGIQLPKIKTIAFVEDEKNADKLWDTFFSAKDIGWKGKIHSVDLQTFIDTKFDALICFYKQNKLETNLVTALSNANFKIGLSHVDDRLYDFIIDLNTKQIEVFKVELKKYLTVLKKI